MLIWIFLSGREANNFCLVEKIAQMINSVPVGQQSDLSITQHSYLNIAKNAHSQMLLEPVFISYWFPH